MYSLLMVFHFYFLGLFSFSLSSSCAMLNCFAAFLMAGLPSSSSPRGSLPSGDMFLILRISSESSLRVVNILFIFATDYILLLIFSNFFFFSSKGFLPSSSMILLMSTPSSSFSSPWHFFMIVISMLLTFSAKKGSDHENTFRPSGSR